jgi:GxxExxY protein
VHKTLRAGLLESVYREWLAIELRTAQLRFETERRIKLKYKGLALANHLRLDLLGEGIIVVELKAVECLHPIHQSQMITYLKLADCPAGLIMNFNVGSLRMGLKRLESPG